MLAGQAYITERLLGLNVGRPCIQDAQRERSDREVLEQPANTPELNTADNSLWVLIETELEAQVRQWEKDHPTLQWEESFEEYCTRVKQARGEGSRAKTERPGEVAFALPEESIYACMGHTKTVLKRLKDAKGWYING